jgi:hypothetical protein
MRLWCDRTGFPLFEPWPGKQAFALLPVTKAQFECFLAEPNDYGNG